MPSVIKGGFGDVEVKCTLTTISAEEFKRIMAEKGEKDNAPVPVSSK